MTRTEADLDQSPLVEQVRRAASARAPLVIRGGGSKRFYGAVRDAPVLDTRCHSGIIDYQPTELVLTARCGTPLVEIERALAEQRQCLAFEPPHFSAHATLGGCVAAGLSGPGRAQRGAVRDFVLGVTVIDGSAQVLTFGGQVMKNVAGYDVARLFAGSQGSLGVILDVSIKVLPVAQCSSTLQFELDQASAIERANQLAGQALPLSASAWQDGLLSIRLSGAASAVEAACQRLGGRRVSGAVPDRLWQSMREQTDPFFAGDAPLWRFSVPSMTPPFRLEGDPLIEWGGALRWYRSAAPAREIFAMAAARGGHASLFRASEALRRASGVFMARSPGVLAIEQRLKAHFDPQRIFSTTAPAAALA
jgi:glycolate oxidase FAD binding subunit